MRFNIRTMMIVIVAIAVVLVSLRFERVFAILFLGLLLLSCGAFARGVWLSARPFRRVARLGFLTSAILVNTICLVASVAFVMLMGKLVVAGVSVFGVPLIFGFGAAWCASGAGANAVPRQSRILPWALTVGLSIAPLTMLFTTWPFRLAFAASRPALEALADEVTRGEPVNTSRWAGAFRIVGSVVDPATGTIGLITDPNLGGRAGFARQHAQAAGSSPFYNLNYDVQLTEKWRYVEED